MEATEPMTLDEAAQSLLAPNPEQEQVEEVDAPDEDQTETDETETDVQDEEDAPDTEEAEEADDVEEAELDDDESEQEADEQPDTFAVKVDGQEVEVTLEELTRGYAGQKYIQKGMLEVAQTRKQTEEIHASLSQQQAQLQQLVTTLTTEGMTPPVAPPIEMSESDPIGYMQSRAQYEADAQRYQQKVNAVQHQQAQAQQAEQQARAAYLAEQRDILAREIPEYIDPEKGPVFQRKLREAGESYGFNEQELAGITDARHVKVLRDAQRYREMVASKETVKAKTKTARPVVKPGAAKAQPNPAQKQRDAAKKRLRETGSVDDAVSLILNQ